MLVGLENKELHVYNRQLLDKNPQYDFSTKLPLDFVPREIKIFQKKYAIVTMDDPYFLVLDLDSEELGPQATR